MNTWQRFYEEGLGFFKTMSGAKNRPEIFNPELMHNLSAMAIEKFIMAYLTYNDSMPFNHTLSDLADAVKRLRPFDDTLEKSLEYMDSLQEICALGVRERKIMTDEDVDVFVRSAQSVYDFVSEELKEELEAV